MVGSVFDEDAAAANLQAVCGEEADGFRIDAVFLDLNARVERFWRVIIQNRYCGLQDDWA